MLLQGSPMGDLWGFRDVSIKDERLCDSQTVCVETGRALHNLLHNLADQRRSQQFTAACRNPKQLKTLKRLPFCMVWPIIGANLTQVKQGKSMKRGRFQALQVGQAQSSVQLKIDPGMKCR